MNLIHFILFFTLANLIAGGKLGGTKLPGRGIYYSGAVAMLLLGYYYGFPGILAGLSFFIWRIPGWHHAIDGGVDQDTRERDFFVMTVRGLATFPFFIYEALKGQALDLYPLAVLFLASAMIATVYDVANRHFNRSIFTAEALTGVVWGFAYAAFLL